MHEACQHRARVSGRGGGASEGAEAVGMGRRGWGAEAMVAGKGAR